MFGTAGEAYAEPSYRFGVRWESPKWIVAATYSDAFDGSGGRRLRAWHHVLNGCNFLFQGLWQIPLAQDDQLKSLRVLPINQTVYHLAVYAVLFVALIWIKGKRKNHILKNP